MEYVQHHCDVGGRYHSTEVENSDKHNQLQS